MRRSVVLALLALGLLAAPAAAATRAVCGLPEDAGGALRAERLAVGRASRRAAPGDPRLADLERAEPDALLDAAARPGLRAALRAAARGRRPRAGGGRPGRAGDPRRAPERELDR